MFPWADWPVTCSWACHIAAHNSDLGTDFACPVGTPIVAAFSGTLSNGTRAEPAPFKPLYIAILRSDRFPNVSFEHMHLSRFAPPGHYNAGDVIGWTGGARYALGSGQATGPHLHVNAIINGQLEPIYTAFTEFASVGPITPITDPTTVGDSMLAMFIQSVPGVGEHYVVMSAAGVTVSAETSVDPAAKAQAQASFDMLAKTLPYSGYTGPQTITDDANGSLLKQIAYQYCRMPSTFALGPGNPYTVLTGSSVAADLTPILTAISNGDTQLLAALTALDTQAGTYQTQLAGLIGAIHVPTKLTGTLG